MFQDLNPLDRSTAITEIIIMLLVAFILGFVLAWILKRSRTVIDHGNDREKNLEERYQELQSKNEQSRQQLTTANNRSVEPSEDSPNNTEVDSLQAQVRQLQDNLRNCEGDRKKNEQLLKDENLQLSKRIKSLKDQLATTQLSLSEIKASDAENAEKLGFVAVASDMKDDLTKISGIGPFIEKKLNGLGIYTFEQISGFTPETVAKVTEAIEFFPGRIERDNWVDQAKALK